jgi:uncharacterized protein with PIN domain
MAHPHSRRADVLAQKDEAEGNGARCPGCGHQVVSVTCTTVALPKAYSFPAEAVVLSALQCGQCGQVTFFNPAVAHPSRPKAS